VQELPELDDVHKPAPEQEVPAGQFWDAPNALEAVHCWNWVDETHRRTLPVHWTATHWTEFPT